MNDKVQLQMIKLTLINKVSGESDVRKKSLSKISEF